MMRQHFAVPLLAQVRSVINWMHHVRADGDHDDYREELVNLLVTATLY